MESAPLTLAHNHARNAALESRKSNPVAASEEHDLAAAEFAVAAQGTKDAEALRILNLLEQHHKRLGQLLKSRQEKPTPEGDAFAEKPASIGPSQQHDASVNPAARQLVSSVSAGTNEPHPPRLSKAARPTARDLSSSIASNLASARGIPNNRQRRPKPVSPTVSTQHVGGRFASDETPPRSINRHGSEHIARDSVTNQQHSRPSWAPPSDAPGLEVSVDPGEDNKGGASDAPFQQFYSTFETLISKISAPLAFAGLPLTSAPQTIPPAPAPQAALPSPKASKPTTPAMDASIDYASLISGAALRAARDGRHPGPAESFYVVPTSGGQISYADIVSRADRESQRVNRGHNRQPSGLSEDDFSDARTTAPSTESLEKSKKPGATLSRDTKTVDGKTMEELNLENQALKQMADNLSRRIYAFELSSQSSTAALAQSVRSLPRSPLSTPENSGRGAKSDSNSNNKARARITELEDILRRTERETERRKQENVKLKDTVLRYREKWEKLKEGARARRDGTGPDKDGTTAVTGHTKGTDTPNLGLGPPVEPERESGKGR